MMRVFEKANATTASIYSFLRSMSAAARPVAAPRARGGERRRGGVEQPQARQVVGTLGRDPGRGERREKHKGKQHEAEKRDAAPRDLGWESPRPLASPSRTRGSSHE